MEGKGIVKFFLVVMAIVCGIQYLLILPTRKVEKEADARAVQVAMELGTNDLSGVEAKTARIAYLDSMSKEEVFRIPLVKGYTYEELKKQQLALGLDLKGGMSVILQVDLRELLVTLSNQSKDPSFLTALDSAKAGLKSTQSDFITLFGQEFEAIAGEKNLASIFSRSATLRDQINFETSNAEVLAILRAEADGTVQRTFNLLKDRIDKLGVVQPNVSLDAARDLILVELPGIDNPERARSFLQSAAKLEFWNVYRISDSGVQNAFLEADRRLKLQQAGDSTALDSAEEIEPEIRIDSTMEIVRDSLGNVIDTVWQETEVEVPRDPFSDKGPLLQLMDLNFTTSEGSIAFPLAVVGVADENKMDQISEYLAIPEIKRLFPQDAFFLWSQKPYKDFSTGKLSGRHELYMLRKQRGSDNAPLEGDHVVGATSQPDPMTQEVAVSLTMDNQGARIWGEMTTRAANDNNREIAIVLDDEVVSAPRVNDPIRDGRSSITGSFSIQEGKDLANILEIGKLPAKTEVVNDAVVGPSLGADNIRRSLTSLIAGFGLVIVFMLFYYGGAGIVSIIALFANLFFIFGALASYGTVLTLPGFAGIILTIGMAVDANVIIYERIREELREGKSLLTSVSDGFKNSYSAIIDANVTTILVAFVLAYFGIGPIKGFAVVLIIGVLFSLFTAVLLTRLMIDYWLSKGKNLAFWSGGSKNLFSNLNIDWLGMRRITYFISGTIIILGIVSFLTRGFDLGVDFKGGYSYTVQFEEGANMEANTLREQLTTFFGSEPVVKSVDTDNRFKIVTDYLIDSDEEAADEMVLDKFYEGMNSILGGSLVEDQFKNADSDGTRIVSSGKVGPTIADDIKDSSVYATIFALLCIFLYLFIRFNKWQFSAGAVAALFHDSMIVLSMFTIFHGIVPWTMEIDQTFIAALLTIIGYSINDTVVIFDRIREYLNQYSKSDKKETINRAINSTLSRTVITSLTTMLVVLILFLFGGASIKGFAFALVIGIISGTYSTVFVATPLVYDLTGDMAPKEVKKKHFSRAVK